MHKRSQWPCKKALIFRAMTKNGVNLLPQQMKRHGLKSITTMSCWGTLQLFLVQVWHSYLSLYSEAEGFIERYLERQFYDIKSLGCCLDILRVLVRNAPHMCASLRTKWWILASGNGATDGWCTIKAWCHSSMFAFLFIFF